MKQFLLVIVLLVAAQVSRADKVDNYLKEEMQKHNIPGAALRVIKRSKTIKTSTYGLANLELRMPVKPETAFEIGSVTKQFTAACLLLLQEDGKLSVDDKIGPHLKYAPDRWTNVTIRHLLTHTSGIKSYTGLDGFALTKRLTQEQFINAIGGQPLEFQPGESWKYSNTGYNLLGYIVENTSGKSYWEFLRERILRPLEMTATTDRNPGTIITNRAAGYEQSNHVHINRDYDLTDVFSAGAMVSTVGDLSKWSSALDAERILTPASKEQMWTPAPLSSGKPAKYGFGWYIDSIDSHRNIGHGGSTSGFSASLQRFPDDGLTVILLTNTNEQVATTLARKVAALYFDSPKLRKQAYSSLTTPQSSIIASD